MNYQDIATLTRLCGTYGTVEVMAVITEQANQSTDVDYKDMPTAIIHQYAPVVNAALAQLVNIRTQYINQQMLAIT